MDKKEFNQLLKIGDIIYVKQIKDKKYSLQQLPKINGGIVVMDPYTGRVLALNGGFSFKKVSLIELHKQKDNQVLHLNHSFMLLL